MAFRTEYPFVLPRGYVDPKSGLLYRHGVMRLATAKDEIVPLQDYRVQQNRAYLVILLLSRVVVRLGEIDKIDEMTIENLFSADLAYLQEFYRKINEEGSARLHTRCPSCSTEFDVDMVSGQAVGAPQGGAAEEGGQPGQPGLG
jgi:hypothetical protein